MFLTANNEIKWRKMGVGALVTGALVMCGIMWFDKPLYLFIHKSLWENIVSVFVEFQPNSKI